MTPILEAHGISAGYNGVPVIRDVDLCVSSGEIVALLGPNGVGKTTTLLALAGAIPVLAGEVLLAGQVETGQLPQRARRGLGFVTQERSVFMELTLEENLRLGRGSIDEALDLFPELKPHMKRQAGLLSGGQQQMLTVARALAGSPSVLLVDELSLGLAPQVADRLLDAIVRAAATGVGVLLVEQKLDRALAVASTAILMQRGQIVLSTEAANLEDRVAALHDIFLGGMSPEEALSIPVTQPTSAKTRRN